MNDETPMTQAAFARHIGMSPKTIHGYARRGVLSLDDAGRLPMPESRHALIRHLAETAAGRGGSEGVADLSLERALLARSQREGQELKNKVASGEYVPVEGVQRAMDNICITVRNRLLAVPSNIPSDLPHLTRNDLDVIDRHIRDALTELADGFNEKESNK